MNILGCGKADSCVVLWFVQILLQIFLIYSHLQSSSGLRSSRLILVSVLWGRVSPPQGTGGPSGAVELIASLEADAERMWQPVSREPVRSCYIFTLSKTIGASVSAGPGFGGTGNGERCRCCGQKAGGTGH